MRQSMLSIVIVSLLSIACELPNFDFQRSTQRPNNPVESPMDSPTTRAGGEVAEVPEVVESSEAATPALLSHLELSLVTLEPAFSPEVTKYTARIKADVEHVTIIAQTNAPSVTLSVDGGESTHSEKMRIPTAVGATYIEIEVTTTSGDMSLYLITVSAEEAPIIASEIDEAAAIRCERACEVIERESLALCIELNGNTPWCHDQAAARYEVCMEKDCAESGDEVLSCKDSCLASGVEYYHTCLQRGESVRECGAQAKSAVEFCVAIECEASSDSVTKPMLPAYDETKTTKN